MAQKEIANAMVRMYPRTRTKLRQLAKKHGLTLAETLERLLSFGLTNQ